MTEAGQAFLAQSQREVSPVQRSLMFASHEGSRRPLLVPLQLHSQGPVL